MHSILESDGVPSDPYEVLCHMGALIIEGRTPLHLSKGTDCMAAGETATKPAKPYSEGPHCPNLMKLHKDQHNGHKCAENSMLCIRHGNLKQHLLHLYEKLVPICIEVSLGPDCLCGELRSQSTLVSATPSKRDVVLEQWIITVIHKRCHEPSEMSVMSLYQALRSLLHFSQMTAWYMSNNGMKPSHVIYRVGVPGESVSFCEDDYLKHDFPLADINKTTSIKISMKTLPRMEKIPSVYCPQHSGATLDVAQGFHPDGRGKELARLAKEKKYFSKSPEPLPKEETNLPLKFQGVRKKTYVTEERKRKKRISMFGSPSSYETDPDLLDGIPPQDVVGNYDFFSRKEIGKAKLGECSFAGRGRGFMFKPQTSSETYCSYYDKSVNPNLDLMIGFQNFSENKSKSDFRTKENADDSILQRLSSKFSVDLLDDRMQISCAISGKHHCKSECDEEVGWNANVEKPKRRRSLSKVLPGEDVKFATPYISPLPVWSGALGSVTETNSNPVESNEPTETPTTESLPLDEPETDFSSEFESLSEPEPEEKSEESSVAREDEEDEEDEEEEDGETEEMDEKEDSSPVDEESQEDAFEEIPESSNPFLDAILRTAKKSNEDAKQINCDNEELRDDICDHVDKSLEKSDIFLQKLKNPITSYITEKMSDFKAKVETVQSEEVVDSGKEEREEEEEDGTETPPSGRNRNHLHLKLGRKKSPAVRNLRDLGSDDGSVFGSSEFLTKSLNRLKSLFDKSDLKTEEEEKGRKKSLEEENNNNVNNTKTIPVPSAQDKLKFRRSLDSAAQLVFHRCSGLPLTSSPAPVRRNNNSFSFDSTLNSVSAIKSALFEPSNSVSSEDENESEGSLRSPASPGGWSTSSKPINYHSLSPLPLLGTFEESVLNGRLEPVSTVHGFTAELGASGSFCPRHMHLPVTVFFYTLGDNDKVSAPYLGHINLGKKGYNVPRSGTIQVTLFNPLRTVVKMFVVVYDLHDMPVNTHTFLRQRTLYMPANQRENVLTDKKETPFEQEDYHKYLRYLIHLRFVSGKTGRIYLHTDIRMMIFRKADVDTATALGNQIDGETFELRSHTHGPINPKFSPRK